VGGGSWVVVGGECVSVRGGRGGGGITTINNTCSLVTLSELLNCTGGESEIKQRINV
jgi:hypothetical protein